MANWLLRYAILLFWESWPKAPSVVHNVKIQFCSVHCAQNCPSVNKMQQRYMLRLLMVTGMDQPQARETASHLHPQILADVSQQNTASHLEKVMASTSFTYSGVETEMCFALSGGGRVHILLIGPQFLMLCCVLMHSLRAIYISWAFYEMNVD